MVGAPARRVGCLASHQCIEASHASHLWTPFCSAISGAVMYHCSLPALCRVTFGPPSSVRFPTVAARDPLTPLAASQMLPVLFLYACRRVGAAGGSLDNPDGAPFSLLLLLPMGRTRNWGHLLSACNNAAHLLQRRDSSKPECARTHGVIAKAACNRAATASNCVGYRWHLLAPVSCHVATGWSRLPHQY